MRYYDTLVPYLRAILVRANDKQYRVVRSKALECISLVGLAVGPEKFREDAAAVMQFMADLQGRTDPDDPVTSQMMFVSGCGCGTACLLACLLTCLLA